MSSCVCKILFKSEQICGCCCKMLRGSLFWDTRYINHNQTLFTLSFRSLSETFIRRSCSNLLPVLATVVMWCDVARSRSYMWLSPVSVVSGWRCELDNNCSECVQSSDFLSATVLSCRESSSHRRSGRDKDRTVLSCLAWRCELVLRECSQRTNWTELNWPAPSWPSYTTRYWSHASASRSWLATGLRVEELQFANWSLVQSSSSAVNVSPEVSAVADGPARRAASRWHGFTWATRNIFKFIPEEYDTC